ncbi:hypothetical protein TSAR_001800 [Trichomalopsis sarcophagae]|uniref:Uncharacterized protein n=1 Tax=Trichomalopsis sarcophagae TaxID=543379 RepID=A0A232EMK0_9HYME|nr:hypothetical protein TSAR_001800 [Trichomalopsis sarcophagae]
MIQKKTLIVTVRGFFGLLVSFLAEL